MRPAHALSLVMAGLVPAIHVFALLTKIVDARHKAGHDGICLVVILA
jgi:hypothetical protein